MGTRGAASCLENANESPSVPILSAVALVLATQLVMMIMVGSKQRVRINLSHMWPKLFGKWVTYLGIFVIR